ncbi:MAG TPA: MarR family winged helix-turn-helix transcriptional regulator [Edaphocola sp.]|nr:MarR family winged helix-turn-helix transcriptional regulator [Edaphocola sp.]
MMNPCEKYDPTINSSLLDQFKRIIYLIQQIGKQQIEKFKLEIETDQLPILMLPYIYPGINQQEIAQLTFRDKSSVNRTIKKLELLKYLTVSENLKDKRQKNISTTEQGEIEAKKIIQIRELMETKLKLAYGEKEYLYLNNTLNDLYDKLQNLIEEQIDNNN